MSTADGGVDYLGAWRARRAEQPMQPATAAPSTPRDRPNYGAKILADEVARVLEATKGTRNPTLNVAALKLGRAIAGGYVDEDEARAELYAAARKIGLVDDDGPRSVTGTISSGIRAGMKTPRDAGDPAPAETGPVLTEIELPTAPSSTSSTTATPRPADPLDRAVETSIADGYLRPGSWLLDLPPNPPAVWGDGETVLWAQGEALMICASPGLGKTTLAGQLVRGRLGLDENVLDLPVLEGKRVLYLMGDRPQQIARALLRAFDRDELADIATGPDARLALGWGPPPADVAKRPELLVELCAAAGADTLVVDSLKDAAIKLTDDEVGATYNRARQLAITAGVEVLELHHLVKRNSDGKTPTSLADVYGSAWLTAGAGSVLLLTGEPGDALVRGLHLKQPREPWGPAWIAHDHEHGRSSVQKRVDVLELLAVTQVQTASSLATAIFETERPNRSQIERARRQLDKLVSSGLAYTTPGRAGGEGGSGATRYHPHTINPTPLGEREQ